MSLEVTAARVVLSGWMCGVSGSAPVTFPATGLLVVVVVVVVVLVLESNSVMLRLLLGVVMVSVTLGRTLSGVSVGSV